MAIEIVDLPSLKAWWIFPISFLLTLTRGRVGLTGGENHSVDICCQWIWCAELGSQKNWMRKWIDPPRFAVSGQMSHKNMQKWWETGGQFTDKITSSKPNQSVYRWDTRKVMSSLTDVTTAYQGLIRTFAKEKSPTKPLKKWAVVHSAALVREFGWIRIPREVSIQGGTPI